MSSSSASASASKPNKKDLDLSYLAISVTFNADYDTYQRPNNLQQSNDIQDTRLKICFLPELALQHLPNPITMIVSKPWLSNHTLQWLERSFAHQPNLAESYLLRADLILVPLLSEKPTIDEVIACRRQLVSDASLFRMKLAEYLKTIITTVMLEYQYLQSPLYSSTMTEQAKDAKNQQNKSISLKLLSVLHTMRRLQSRMSSFVGDTITGCEWLSNPKLRDRRPAPNEILQQLLNENNLTGDTKRGLLLMIAEQHMARGLSINSTTQKKQHHNQRKVRRVVKKHIGTVDALWTFGRDALRSNEKQKKEQENDGVWRVQDKPLWAQCNPSTFLNKVLTQLKSFTRSVSFITGLPDTIQTNSNHSVVQHALLSLHQRLSAEFRVEPTRGSLSVQYGLASFVNAFIPLSNDILSVVIDYSDTLYEFLAKNLFGYAFQITMANPNMDHATNGVLARLPVYASAYIPDVALLKNTQRIREYNGTLLDWEKTRVASQRERHERLSSNRGRKNRFQTKHQPRQQQQEQKQNTTVQQKDAVWIATLRKSMLSTLSRFIDSEDVLGCMLLQAYQTRDYYENKTMLLKQLSNTTCLLNRLKKSLSVINNRMATATQQTDRKDAKAKEKQHNPKQEPSKRKTKAKQNRQMRHVHWNQLPLSEAKSGIESELKSLESKVQMTKKDLEALLKDEKRGEQKQGGKGKAKAKENYLPCASCKQRIDTRSISGTEGIRLCVQTCHSNYLKKSKIVLNQLKNIPDNTTQLPDMFPATFPLLTVSEAAKQFYRPWMQMNREMRRAARVRFSALEVWRKADLFSSSTTTTSTKETKDTKDHSDHKKGAHALMQKYNETMATEQYKMDMTGTGKYVIAARDRPACGACNGCTTFAALSDNQQKQNELICETCWFPAFLCIKTVMDEQKQEQKLVIVCFPGYAPSAQNQQREDVLLQKYKAQDPGLLSDVNLRVFLWDELDQLAGQIAYIKSEKNKPQQKKETR